MKGDVQMVNKYIKICSILSIIEEMIKPYYSKIHSLNLLKFKRLVRPSAGKDVEQLKCSYITDGVQDGKPLWKKHRRFKKKHLPYYSYVY